jgi:aspartate/methionine/tyrosine aminotransferase
MAGDFVRELLYAVARRALLLPPTLLFLPTLCLPSRVRHKFIPMSYYPPPPPLPPLPRCRDGDDDNANVVVIAAVTATVTAGAGVVKESTIRQMSRLAVAHHAVNLSQGFPNEPPPLLLRLQLAWAVLTGQPFDNDHDAAAASTAAATDVDSSSSSASTMTTVEESLRASLIKLLLQAGKEEDDDDEEQGKGNGSANKKEEEEAADSSLIKTRTTTTTTTTTTDVLNQYSPPMGRPDLRQAIATYYKRFYQYHVSPDDITVTLGATEAVAAALRTIGRPGDKCVIFEPFHELYPSQCHIFYLEPVFVTLRRGRRRRRRENSTSPSTTPIADTTSVDEDSRWTYDPHELKEALVSAQIILLNSPHNPTGKVFTKQELTEIVAWCVELDVYIITDDIYEHMVYNGGGTVDRHHNNNNYQPHHILIPHEYPIMADRTLVCNSIGKSAAATGWRVGWCLHPPQHSDTYRAIHDQLTVMSPHPMQYATISYLTLPDTYFLNLTRRYQERVEMMVTILQDLGFFIALPEGAYYLFVDYKNVPALTNMSSMEAAMFLLTTVGVACVPGDIFYGKAKEDGQQYLRFAACRSISDLREAARRLARLPTMTGPGSEEQLAYK